ncbi:MAG TPA: biotin--[acetyl-CoA-carboxylase] ligase [Thermoplasmata archaeon]|nr:biotin--[acetyl-CoA-carboxylase] ligase [Thermoplasmata archaeon]
MTDSVRAGSTVQRRFFETVDSTQGEARRWVRADGPLQGLVVAAAQTHGVGRADHRWESPRGGLYLSSIISVGSAPTSGLLSLAVGAALADDLAARLRFQPALKWPNDLVVVRPGRLPAKFGGLLVDFVTLGAGEGAVIVGLGMNVRTSRSEFPLELRDSITSLAEVDPSTPELGNLEQRADSVIRVAVRDLETEAGKGRALARVRALLYGVGRTACIDGVVVGRIQGVEESGGLVVAHGGVESIVLTGDLTFEAEPAAP